MKVIILKKRENSFSLETTTKTMEAEPTNLCQTLLSKFKSNSNKKQSLCQCKLSLDVLTFYTNWHLEYTPWRDSAWPSSEIHVFDQPSLSHPGMWPSSQAAYSFPPPALPPIPRWREADDAGDWTEVAGGAAKWDAGRGGFEGPARTRCTRTGHGAWSKKGCTERTGRVSSKQSSHGDIASQPASLSEVIGKGGMRAWRSPALHVQVD